MLVPMLALPLFVLGVPQDLGQVGAQAVLVLLRGRGDRETGPRFWAGSERVFGSFSNLKHMGLSPRGNYCLNY